MKLTELHEIAGIASTIFTSCVIGGGAPRDVFLGGPVKDIDLFVDMRTAAPSSFRSGAFELATKLGGTLVRRQGPTVHYQGGRPDYAEGTIDIERPDGPPVQVIAIQRCPYDDVFAYDFGISQVLVTPRGILRTNGFDRDMRNHTITYLGDYSWDLKGRRRSAARLQRLKAKYPDRAVVHAEALAGLEQPKDL